jgi:hypothetical protein
LHAKNIVGLKNSYEVFLLQVGLLEFIQVFVERVSLVLFLLLNPLQVLKNVFLCVFRAFLEHIGHQLVEEFINAVINKVVFDFLDGLLVLLSNTKVFGNLGARRYFVVTRHFVINY